MCNTVDFILALRDASTADPVAILNDDALDRLRNPPNTPPVIENPGIWYSISIHLALEHSSQDAYERVCHSTIRNFSGAPGVDDIQSFYNVERTIRTFTGVEPIHHDMCSNTCLTYTGPFADLDACLICGTSRWNQQTLQGSNGHLKLPAQTFTTIPLAPQLQACNRDPESAHAMRYLHERTRQILDHFRDTQTIPVVDDIAMGWDYLGAVLEGDITENDIVVMVSLDGAQLYDSRELDCWIYIWIILNLPPDQRYKKLHVLPGGFIPGPNKPKNVDSFIFPDLHHLAAIQREGLPMWNPLNDSQYISNVYLLFTTADGPGLIYWDGMVGHSGRNGCRLYCGVLGRRKERGTHYYPALLRPLDCAVDGSNHPDIDVFKLPLGGSSHYAENLQRIMSVPNQTQWDKTKTETGLTKPPLILGLDHRHSLGVPLSITTDIMHLAGNLSDLLISLWHATIDVSANDDCATWDWAVLGNKAVWAAHGKDVEDAGRHLPGSYDRKPRNIAEKINTQYKTWEFQLYTFGIAPTLLYGILPTEYWSHYCMLVCGFQIMCQHSITQQQLVDAHLLLCSWEHNFEQIYYQQKESRIHFIRPAVHQVTHLVTEAIQKGPPLCYAQWTMERTISNLGQELRQPSKPYANMAQEGVRRCQVNALLSMMPELDTPPKGLPNGAKDLGDGYALLRKCARYPTLPDNDITHQIAALLPPGQPMPCIQKWSCLLLPNGQIARSLWREALKAPEQLRISSNVKVQPYYLTRLFVHFILVLARGEYTLWGGSIFHSGRNKDTGRRLAVLYPCHFEAIL